MRLLCVVFWSLSQVQLFATSRTAVSQATLSLIISQSLLKLMSVESVMPSNHLILCHPFSSSLQSFPASESFPIGQLFTLGGQSIGASASVLVLPMNFQGWYPLGLTGLISLQSKGLSSVFFSTPVEKHQFLGAQSSLWSSSHDYWKNHSFDHMNLCQHTVYRTSITFKQQQQQQKRTYYLYVACWFLSLKWRCKFDFGTDFLEHCFI